MSDNSTNTRGNIDPKGVVVRGNFGGAIRHRKVDPHAMLLALSKHQTLGRTGSAADDNNGPEGTNAEI